MNIIINEQQLQMLESTVKPIGFQETKKKIDNEKATLERFIEHSGEYMTDITNNKTYLVQYLKTLSNLVGKEYAVCAPVKSDGTYGAFYVKPYGSFRKMHSTISNNAKPMKRKPNLYQQMGLNI